MKSSIGVVATVLLLAGSSCVAAETKPAWQEPGFVMEEVVVTATARDVIAAEQQRLHRLDRTLVALQTRDKVAR